MESIVLCGIIISFFSDSKTDKANRRVHYNPEGRLKYRVELNLDLFKCVDSPNLDHKKTLDRRGGVALSPSCLFV